MPPSKDSDQKQSIFDVYPQLKENCSWLTFENITDSISSTTPPAHSVFTGFEDSELNSLITRTYSIDVNRERILAELSEFIENTILGDASGHYGVQLPKYIRESSDIQTFCNNHSIDISTLNYSRESGPLISTILAILLSDSDQQRASLISHFFKNEHEFNTSIVLIEIVKEIINEFASS